MFQTGLFNSDISPAPVASETRITGFKGRLYTIGCQVRGYRDLNSKDSQYFSIQAKGGEHAGKVLDHGVSVAIDNAVFNVRQGGQARVRREKVRNVHAFVEGTLSDVSKTQQAVLAADFIEVTYNPFYTDTFIVKATGQPVTGAATAVLQNGSVFCRGLTFSSM